MSILLGIAAVGLAASVIKKRQAANELYGSMVTQAVKDQVNSARQQGILDELENSRQDIINPYEDVKDLSGDMSNSFNNLGVATQAAEMQMEQSDIALANTLHSVTFYTTLKHCPGGSTSAGVLKGLQAVLVFLASSIILCGPGIILMLYRCTVHSKPLFIKSA